MIFTSAQKILWVLYRIVTRIKNLSYQTLQPTAYSVTEYERINNHEGNALFCKGSKRCKWGLNIDGFGKL